MWRKDWSLTADPISLQRAIVDLCRAARNQPTQKRSLMILTPLLVETGELECARGAAEMAWETDSSRVETWLRTRVHVAAHR